VLSMSDGDENDWIEDSISVSRTSSEFTRDLERVVSRRLSYGSRESASRPLSEVTVFDTVSIRGSPAISPTAPLSSGQSSTLQVSRDEKRSSVGSITEGRKSPSQCPVGRFVESISSPTSVKLIKRKPSNTVSLETVSTLKLSVDTSTVSTTSTMNVYTLTFYS